MKTNIDQAALDVATKIMGIAYGKVPPGGPMQIKALIQCAIIEAIEQAAPPADAQPVAYMDPVSGQCWPARAGVIQPEGVKPLYAHPSPTTAPASESIDTPEFRQVAADHATDATQGTFNALVAHINAHTAAQVAASKAPVAAPVLTDNEKIDLFRDAMKANGCVAQLAAISFANAIENHAVSVCGRDTARLNWLYSRKKTQSCALLDLELRMINEDYPTPQEAREAIDAAMQRGEGEKG